MINIYFCDDDQSVVQKYQYLIKKYAMARSLAINLEIFNRGENLIFYLQDNPVMPDIIFLDIFMDKMNGIEVAQKIREMGVESHIIFLTTSSDFVFEAFDVRSFNYLVKQDTDEARFRDVLSSAITMVEKKATNFFTCSMGAETRNIPISEIVYFEIYRRVMRVYFNGDQYFDFYETMDQLSTDLESQGFIRVHRSYLVNMAHVVLFEKQHISLTNGAKLAIGRAYQSDIRSRFNSFILEEID